MIDLPGHGDRVKVWPIPGKEVPGAPVALGSESFNVMQPDGAVVTWDPYHYELFLRGQIALHDPRHHDGSHAIRTFTAHHHFHAAVKKAEKEGCEADLEEIRILAMSTEQQAKERGRLEKMNERHARATAKSLLSTPEPAAPPPEGKV